MLDEKTDRRVQRTRQMLRGALVQLIKEKGYDMVTIQDITERANLGRTTFYLHYQTKEDLLFDHHAQMSTHFNLSILTRDELLGDIPQLELVTYLQLLTENRPMYHAIRAAKESTFLLRGIREQIVSNLQNSLQVIFPSIEPKIPLDVLTTYIVGAQLSLIHWWMTTHTPYTAVHLATMLHHLQRTAICDAYQSTS
jgi:AcrR family transcriptional regulator